MLSLLTHAKGGGDHISSTPNGCFSVDSELVKDVPTLSSTFLQLLPHFYKLKPKVYPRGRGGGGTEVENKWTEG